jgi:sugar phosphate isomerase/epimerase
MRTSFLQRVILVISSVLIAATVQAQIEIGLQLYSFRNQIPKDVPGALQKISAMGFRYLEGGGTYKLSKEEFKQLLDKNNLKMVSYGAGFEDLEKDPQAVAEKAAFFGSKYVMCSWVPHKGEVFTIDDTKRAVAVFNAAGKIMKEKGCNLFTMRMATSFSPMKAELISITC